ncbi:MAG: hypothetical protein IPK97_09700 [Ahniella sp.]|nr:hypothetical protein [Ahniella sp.]
MGNTIELRTESVNATQVVSTVNRLRLNGGPEEVFTCSTTTRLTRGEYLFCRLPTVGAEGYTLVETQPADYLDRTETLGSLSNGGNAGLVGNDIFSGIRVRNNLVTGASDRGTGFLFGEFPVFAELGGRVYLEGSVPPNVQDDDPDEDPPIATELRLSCAPASSGDTVTNTDIDGNYRFSRVPVGATCVITELQPAGFNNAYNTMGPGGLSETGGAQSGRGDSTIQLVVPPTGSFGNNFAETTATAGLPPQKVPTSPVSLVILFLLILAAGAPFTRRTP